jgi:hypothetical protein
MVRHSPWALFICERTPLPIEITAKGYERIGKLQEVRIEDIA